MDTKKTKLYIHVKQATHFLRWEIPYWNDYFQLVDIPEVDTALLTFGPDALESGVDLPASKRFAVLFPGFDHNPLYNPEVKKLHLQLISKYDWIFINPGPLEIAYNDIRNKSLYPFSVDVNFVKFKKYRKNINSLIHVSSDVPQKDWQRSELIMQKTGLKYEVFPPRNKKAYDKQLKIQKTKNTTLHRLGLSKKLNLPYGYFNHELVVKKYQQYDGFVHVAKNIKDKFFIDGKYTASMIEAGVTGCILFWHDTFNLGNSLETVFDLPLDEDQAAKEILNIRNSIDIKKHSIKTREEMLDIFNPMESVKIRAEKMYEIMDKHDR